MFAGVPAGLPFSTNPSNAGRTSLGDTQQAECDRARDSAPGACPVQSRGPKTSWTACQPMRDLLPSEERGTSDTGVTLDMGGLVGKLSFFGLFQESEGY